MGEVPSHISSVGKLPSMSRVDFPLALRLGVAPHTIAEWPADVYVRFMPWLSGFDAESEKMQKT